MKSQVSEMYLLLLGLLAINFGLITGNGCPKPSSISNGHYEFINSPDWPKSICRVQYSCDLGYKMNGAGLRFCFHSHWVGQTPICDEISCPQLKAPGNGSMAFVDNEAPANQLDSIVQFLCDDGFILEGEPAVICLSNNEWSANVPVCVSDDCHVIDACADGSHGCVYGTCRDNDDSYACVCDAGWEGDLCDADIDECADGSNNCHANATCTNTPGSFTCACDSGYNGNGTSCIDIDECADGSNNCHANATCTNTPGSFTCACNSGYNGNGTSCIEPRDCENDGGLLFDSKCFFLTTTKAQLFVDAVQGCSSVHADSVLASITSDEIFEAVVNFIQPQVPAHDNYYLWTSGRYDALNGGTSINWGDGSTTETDNWGNRPWGESHSHRTHVYLRVGVSDEFTNIYDNWQPNYSLCSY